MKNIEYTYATKELRKEFLRLKDTIEQRQQTYLSEASKTKMWAQTIDEASAGVKCGLPYVFIGSLRRAQLDDYELCAISASMCDIEFSHLVTEDIQSCRSLYQEFGPADSGALYKSRHTAIAELEDRDMVVQIRRILLISVRDRYIHVLEVDTSNKIAVQQNLGADIVEPFENGMFIKAVCIKRKVMLMNDRDQQKQQFIVVDHHRKLPIRDPSS